MVVLVDLNRCQSYGQCVFAAPAVFRMPHPEALEWDYQPPASEGERIERARHACPVQAITIGTESEDAQGDAERQENVERQGDATAQGNGVGEGDVRAPRNVAGPGDAATPADMGSAVSATAQRSEL